MKNDYLGDFDFVYSEIFSHENFKTTTVLALNTRLYKTLSIFHLERTNIVHCKFESK